MLKKIPKIHTYSSSNITGLGAEAVNQVEKIVLETGAQVENYVSPVRQSILKRYPTLFGLLVTVGATTTFLGLEQIFLRVDLLATHPELLFLLGVGILALTGRLYKKLSQ